MPAALGAWAGAAFVIAGASRPPASIVAALACVCVSAFAASLTFRRDGRTTSAAVAASMGLAVMAFLTAAVVADWHTRSPLESPPPDLVDGGEAQIRGTVVAPPRVQALRGEDAAFADVRLTGWRAASDEGDSWRPARGTVTVVTAPGALERDDHVVVGGDVESPTDPRRSPIMWEANIVSSEDGTGALALTRRWLSVATAHLPPATGGLVLGMLTGDTSTMPSGQVADMRTAGLAHLTAVSGAHFAIVAMMVGTVVSAVRGPRWMRAPALVAATVTFAALVGMAPSVGRALAMACVVALAVALGRPARGLASLGVAVICVALCAPRMTVEIGFAMSVVAVAAIVWWAPLIAMRLTRLVTPRAATALSVPFAAQAALTPLLLVLQPGIGTWAVVANLVVVPFLIPLMACGVAAALVGPWWHDGGSVLIGLAALAARPIGATADVVSGLPGATLPWAPGLRGTALAVAALIALVLATASSRRPWRRLGALLAAASALVAIGPAVVPGAVVDDWDVVACDVGQGDAMLLRAGPHDAVVIDTGPRGGGVETCLRRYGVRTVPLLVLTHPHADHDGATDAVLNAARVEAAWVSAAAADSRAVAQLRQAGVPTGVPATGQTWNDGDAQLEVISTTHVDTDVDNPNDASIVILASARATSVLALGDLEPGSQRDLAARLHPQAVGVVKIAHHGSAAQDAGLAEDIHAGVAVISAGRDNDYGHPAQAALDLYRDRVDTLAVTATCGDVVVVTAPTGAVVPSCRRDVAP